MEKVRGIVVGEPTHYMLHDQLRSIDPLLNEEPANVVAIRGSDEEAGFLDAMRNGLETSLIELYGSLAHRGAHGVDEGDHMPRFKGRPGTHLVIEPFFGMGPADTIEWLEQIVALDAAAKLPGPLVRHFREHNAENDADYLEAVCRDLQGSMVVPKVWPHNIGDEDYKRRIADKEQVIIEQRMDMVRALDVRLGSDFDDDIHERVDNLSVSGQLMQDFLYAAIDFAVEAREAGANLMLNTHIPHAALAADLDVLARQVNHEAPPGNPRLTVNGYYSTGLGGNIAMPPHWRNTMLTHFNGSEAFNPFNVLQQMEFMEIGFRGQKNEGGVILLDQFGRDMRSGDALVQAVTYYDRHSSLVRSAAKIVDNLIRLKEV